MDTDLVVRAQRGDKEAYAVLAAGIADRFLAVARRILRDIDLAEDATQQALLAIWQDLPQLRDPARFEAWSYRLLVRACYAEGRKERRWAPNIRLLPADEPMAADRLDSVVDRDQLERGFRRLSIDHRTVVVLHHYLDLPLDRVAEILGIPVGTAHSRLHYAMRGLRAALDADARPRRRRLPNERRSRHHAHRPVVAADGRARVRGPRPRRRARPARHDPTAPAPGGRRGGSSSWAVPFDGGAAAVIVAVGFIGAFLVYGNGGVGIGASTPSSSATQTVPPSPTPVASGSLPQSGSVIQGSYTIADPFPIQLGLEIGPGWTMWSPGVEAARVALYKGSPDPPAGLAIGFLGVQNVLADQCDQSAGDMDPPVGPAPIDLAEALASQTGTESTTPFPWR